MLSRVMSLLVTFDHVTVSILISGRLQNTQFRAAQTQHVM